MCVCVCVCVCVRELCTYHVNGGTDEIRNEETNKMLKLVERISCEITCKMVTW